MELTALGHAAFLVRIESGAVLLVDPWLEDPACVRSWWHFPPLHHKLSDLGAIDGVLLTSGRSDRADRKTLGRLGRDAESQPPAGLSVTRKGPGSFLLEDRGVSVLVAGERAPVAESEGVDLALLPLAPVSPYPVCFEMPAAEKLAALARLRSENVARLAESARALRCRAAAAIGAGWCLASPDQWWMNDLYEPASPPGLFEMEPGDRWSSRTGFHRAGASPPRAQRHAYVRTLGDAARAARAEEPIPAPALDERFLRFAWKEAPPLRTLFDVRGPAGFIGMLDRGGARLGENGAADLRVRIPSAVLDAILEGRASGEDALASHRLWFEPRAGIDASPFLAWMAGL